MYVHVVNTYIPLGEESAQVEAAVKTDCHVYSLLITLVLFANNLKMQVSRY